MTLWKELKNTDRQYEMVHVMEKSRNGLHYIIDESDEYSQNFDYVIDCYVDHHILLFDDGFEFASADTDQFKNAADFMRWVMGALQTYYYDEEREEEDGN